MAQHVMQSPEKPAKQGFRKAKKNIDFKLDHEDTKCTKMT